MLWWEREFSTDRAVYRVGLGRLMAEYLEGLQVLDCAIPGVGRAHPYVKQRLVTLEELEV